MTEQAQSPDPAAAQPGRRRRIGMSALSAALVVVLAGVFAGSFASNAWSHRFGGFCGFMMGSTDPGRAERRAAVFADNIADRVDASADQREKLVSIARSAARDIAPIRQKMRDTRKLIIEALTQASIDRNRVEQLRTEQVASVEAISKRLTQAIGDASEALTPEQRKKLAEALPMGEHGMGHGGWWGRWGHPGWGGGDWDD